MEKILEAEKIARVQVRNRGDVDMHWGKEIV